MRIGRCALIGIVMLGSLRARAVAEEKGAELKERLAAQEALNRELLERLESLEASQASLLKTIDTIIQHPDNDAERKAAHDEEREALMDELREEFGEEFAGLEDRLDLLPDLGGYYDFEYINDGLKDSPGEFRQHHVSLFLAKEYDDFRFFSEIEFEFGTRFGGEGGLDLEEARGEFKLEQAWAERHILEPLTLRGGLALTPGYWNVNHYPNVVLSTRRPLMVRRVFPESFVGVMGYGTKYWDDFGVTYYAYLGNGVSDDAAKNDDNEGKAVGGRVSFHIPTKGKFETFDVGLSGYHESPTGEQRTRTWGFDAQVREGPWEVLTEFAARDAEEDRTGFYFQPSYRYNEKWAAFYRYDMLHIEHLGTTQEHSVGVNYRPIPEVSLKLEYFRSVLSFDEDSNGVAASIAISF
ncbi:MAG: hypothetical protein ACE5EQ_02290 [Phycisphaerae bacterium]